jgi:hypothetical protein
MEKYIALKNFGGGKKLREQYGRGPGNLVEAGTVIELPKAKAEELEGMRLVAPFTKERAAATPSPEARLARAMRGYPAHKGAPAKVAKA